MSSQVQENLSDYQVSLGVSISSQCWFCHFILIWPLNEMLRKLASNNLEMLPLYLPIVLFPIFLTMIEIIIFMEDRIIDSFKQKKM